MAVAVDLGADSLSLVERLRRVCLGQWALEKDGAERALAEHLRALGVESRPVRWEDPAAGLLAAWEAGLFRTGSGVVRSNDAVEARLDAEGAGDAELNAVERATRKAATSASAAVEREAEITIYWHLDVAQEQAIVAMPEWRRRLSAGERAGQWVSDTVARHGLFGMLTPFTTAQTKEAQATQQMAFALAAPQAAWAALWAARAHVLSESGAGCAAVDRLVEIYRPLIDAVEAGVWLLWLLEDEVLAVAAPGRQSGGPVRDRATGEWKPREPAIEHFFERKLGRLDRVAQQDAIKVLPGHLDQGEGLLTLAAASLARKQGLLAVTTTRLLFVRTSLMGTTHDVVELPYASVMSAVEVGGELQLTTAGERLTFAIKDPQRAEVLAIVQERAPKLAGEAPRQALAEAPSPAPARESDRAAARESPHQATIDRLYRQLGRLDRWGLEKLVKVLPDYLKEEDELLALAFATLGKEHGLLALTDSCLLFIPPSGVDTKTDALELAYTSLSAAADESAQLHVQAASGEFKFFIKGAKRKELLAIIETRMPQPALEREPA